MVISVQVSKPVFLTGAVGFDNSGLPVIRNCLKISDEKKIPPPEKIEKRNLLSPISSRRKSIEVRVKKRIKQP